MTPQNLANLLERTLAAELPALRAVTETHASAQPLNPGAWTRKEELGHLIDSATNNNVRFVRITLEEGFAGPSYAQDNWVTLHGYRELSWSVLVDIWHGYNLLLVRLVERIPEDRLQVEATIGSARVTLQFLIEDYVLHMRHHLDHILAKDQITPYPAQSMGV